MPDERLRRCHISSLRCAFTPLLSRRRGEDRRVVFDLSPGSAARFLLLEGESYPNASLTSRAVRSPECSAP